MARRPSIPWPTNSQPPTRRRAKRFFPISSHCCNRWPTSVFLTLPMASESKAVSPPLGMLAELTHRCPLACPYCSNPLELDARNTELDTATWKRVFAEAAAMGVLQVHLSGGEPASRRDLEELTKEAHDRGLYTNLITSAVGVTPNRLEALAAAGLDHIQISIQDSVPDSADRIAGYKGAYRQKVALAHAATKQRLLLT